MSGDSPDRGRPLVGLTLVFIGGLSVLAGLAPAVSGPATIVAPASQPGANSIGAAITAAPVADCDLSTTEIEPGESVTLNASDSENTSAYRYSENGTSSFRDWIDSPTRNFTYDTAGTYEPYVQVRSADDSTDTVSCGTLIVDENDSPSADFEYSPSSPAPGEEVSFTEQASDEDGEVQEYAWRVDGEVVSREPTFQYTFDTTGSYDVELTVWDDDGASDTVTRTVTVESANQAPTAEVSVEPTEPRVGEDVTLTADASDPDGDVVDIVWRVDGEVIGSERTTTHTFDEPGDHLVNLTVTDDDGASDSVVTPVTVTGENEPPAVEFLRSRERATSGETVTFSVEANDTDGEILSYEWRVDGKLVGDGPSLEYTFEEAGSYRVEVEVTDDDRASTTVGVTVEVDPAAQTSTPTGEINLITRWGYTPLDPRPGQRVTLFANGPVDPRITYQWDVDADGTYEEVGRRTIHAFTEPGPHTVTLAAVGPDGSRATRSSTITVLKPGSGKRVDERGLSLWMSPLNPQPGQRVTFVANPGVPERDVEVYRWDLDGDGAIEMRGRTVTFAFPAAGQFQVAVETVRSNGEVASNSVTVTTRNGVIPSESTGPAIWMTPLDPQPGQGVTLMAEPVVQTADVAAYRWDLDGDGKPDREGRAVRYSFPEDGTFSVRLIVERTNGSAASVERLVAVGNATLPAPTTDDGSDTGPDQDARTAGPLSELPWGVSALALVGVVMLIALAVLTHWRRADE